MKTKLFAILGLSIQILFAEKVDYSLLQEINHALKSAQHYLLEQQHSEGYWGDKSTPAMTGLAIQGILNGPKLSLENEIKVQKGLDFLLKNQKENGGIYADEGLFTYNTALSVLALSTYNREADRAAILKARKFLVGQQKTGDIESSDEPFTGGVGYGNRYSHSDLSNTYFALQALKASKKLLKENDNQPRLDWDSALTFVSRAQNLTETNDQPWASDDAKNKGGFVYFPGNSKAGEETLPNGKTALRSYGSISYAGLMSLIYADLSIDDPRVVAVKEWISKNYTLKENPGMGLQGLYYYYQAMAKSLNSANIDFLILADGKTINWRNQLGSLLVQTQAKDGSWANTNARWWEKDPLLVTAYVMLALGDIK